MLMTFSASFNSAALFATILTIILLAVGIVSVDSKLRSPFNALACGRVRLSKSADLGYRCTEATGQRLPVNQPIPCEIFRDEKSHLESTALAPLRMHGNFTGAFSCTGRKRHWRNCASLTR